MAKRYNRGNGRLAQNKPSIRSGAVQVRTVVQRVILRVKFPAPAVIAALVAQWIEHPPPKGRVTRSIRVEGTTNIDLLW